MKKLQKLSLKELGNSAIRLSLGEANGLKGGWPTDVQRDMDASCGGGGMIVLYGGTLLPEFTSSGKDALYGNYLGPGVNADPQTLGLVPINQLDSACYKHDQAYYALGASGVSGALFNRSVAFADAHLANDAWQAATNSSNDPLQRVVAAGTAVVFGAISALKIDSLTP